LTYIFDLQVNSAIDLVDARIRHRFI
jgi:hypothetical protein